MPPSTLWPFPKEIPHAAVLLKQQSKGLERIFTAIDPDLQRQVEQLVGRHRVRLNQLDIHHIAVLVVDNQSHEIRSIVGGFDFFDLTQGPKSLHLMSLGIGSTLKPFYMPMLWIKDWSFQVH